MRGTSPERTRRCCGRGCAGELEVGFEHLHGVAGAALLGLQDEVDAGGGDGGSDALGFVADDAVDVVGGDDGFGGGDDVEEEGAGRRSRGGLWGACS